MAFLVATVFGELTTNYKKVPLCLGEESAKPNFKKSHFFETLIYFSENKRN